MNNENRTHTLIGDVLIGKDEDGDYGNLTVEGTLTAHSIISEVLPGYNYTEHIEGNGQQTYWMIDHNLDALPPSITMLDGSGNFVFANFKVITKNRIMVEFKEAPLIGSHFYVGVRK